MHLGKRQDLSLEQAVCSLLLGQTEAASRALELSQEYGPSLHSRTFPRVSRLATGTVSLWRTLVANRSVSSLSGFSPPASFT